MKKLNLNFSPFKKIFSFFPIALLSLITLFLVVFNFKKLFLTSRSLKVIGFLPYWNMVGDYQVDFDTVDQLIYFSLLVDELGEFDQTDPGFINYQNPKLDQLLAQAQEKQKQVLLCIASFDADVMYQVTADPEIRRNLIQNITTEVKTKNFDGIDMDFEYFWRLNHGDDFGLNFNLFLAELRHALDQIDSDLVLSVDIYPKAFIENQPYQLIAMNDLVDQIIIMAYDYTLSVGSFSGPVAPIKTDFKLQIEDNYSIFQTLKALEGKIDKDKAILGMPLYGYRWQTIDDQHRSQVVGGRADTIQYQDTQELITEQKPQLFWDDLAQSPWLTYEENGLDYQLYFENLESLKAKFQTALDFNLPGVAFWALGYEGNEADFWQKLN